MREEDYDDNPRKHGRVVSREKPGAKKTPGSTPTSGPSTITTTTTLGNTISHKRTPIESQRQLQKNESSMTPQSGDQRRYHPDASLRVTISPSNQALSTTQKFFLCI
eukprot:UN29997